MTAAELRVGSLLQTSAGTKVQVVAIRAWPAHQRVHNLTINDLHTYYVGAQGGGNGTDVLVHNNNCPQVVGANAARREAMRQFGVPTSAQPVETLTTKAGKQYIYEVSVPGGGKRRVAVTDQTTDRVPGHGPHWEVGWVKPEVRDGLGRHRIYNEGKVKLDYEP